MIYRFGPFALDTQSRELYHEGQVCADLSAHVKVFDVLVHLIEHRDRVVPYEELLDLFWPPEANTTAAAMPQLIGRIRHMVHDPASQQTVIKTFPRVGYRFVAAVEIQAATASPSPTTRQPFVVGPPLTHPVHFFGRERELSRLFAWWKDFPLHHVAIVGPRRSGKTSLLRYVQHITTTPPQHLRHGQRADWLPEPARYRWVFVDFQDPRLGSREGFCRYLLTRLALPAPTPCDLARFLETMECHLQSPTVVLLDEIDVALHRYAELDDVFWEGLRSLASSEEIGDNLAFVLASGQPPHQLAHTSAPSSPFFNIFTSPVELGPLTEPEARELIASSPRPFSAADTDWILEHSQCWPLLVQMLCRERLVTLESEATDDAWRERGLRQLEPFRYLVDR